MKKKKTSRKSEKTREVFIAREVDVPEGKVLKFRLKGEGGGEAFLFQRKGKFYAYWNLCRHWSVPLDWDDGVFFTEDGKYLLCRNHGALYDPKSGECWLGPCAGAFLHAVALTIKDGKIYADRTHEAPRT